MGVGGIFKALSRDLPAGIVVFLVALPLSLGIALASGMSALSGIIAGTIGGLVTGAISGSPLTISGPPAALTMILSSALLSFDGVAQVGAAILLAGVCQILLGCLKVGFISNFLPSAVVNGMLSYVGTVLVLKQLPLLFVQQASPKIELLSLFDHPLQGIGSLWDAVDFHEGVVLLALISITTLILTTKLQDRYPHWLRWFPPALLVVVVGSLSGSLIQRHFPGFLTLRDYIQLPVMDFQSLANLLVFPDFSRASEPAFWVLVMTIAGVASIGSLLTLEATDQLDPIHRVAPQNRELIAQGVGNILCGLLGGMPIAAVIVRSSANVEAGAKTRLASFVYGGLLGGTALFIPWMLNHIPYACLATILVMIGGKLISPSVLQYQWKRGWLQFVPYVVTLSLSLSLNLMVGVLSGLVVAACCHAWVDSQGVVSLTQLDHHYLLRFHRSVNFLQKAQVRDLLREIPEGSKVLLDTSAAARIDQDVEETLEQFMTSAPYRGITVLIQE